MAEAFQFELVSPERLLLSEEATQVVVPGVEGEFGVMAGHAPMMSTLRPGVLTVSRPSSADETFFVRGGFAEAGPKGLTVLAEVAVPMADLKADDVARQIREAEEDIADASDDEARERARIALDHLRDMERAVTAQ
ncbi:F0F1 ATP synthase subunit epsilon [Stappia sp. ES.058]|uniref:F0F1 ATP synthase subunit epsilon n=1 Tax=Stappia sp. ES.058 TaxID=1881061 RepID=UPI000879F44E|nr:F0F1 ATP synthase subunit epsilon [Stappia sp. ES.058]SDU47214.1 ATP synthase F1 subcomplex epsilon subunit [Stappia sp. ES.058]